MAITGMRALLPGGKSMSITGALTLRGRPSLGARCIRKPGPALTSNTAPPVSGNGTLISLVITSMPQMSRPTTRAILSAMNGCRVTPVTLQGQPVSVSYVFNLRLKAP